MARLDPYASNYREEQKIAVNNLLGIIYESYDATRKIQSTVDSVYRMVLALLIIVILLLIAVAAVLCFFGCRRYQDQERPMPLHSSTSRKPAPIEI